MLDMLKHDAIEIFLNCWCVGVAIHYGESVLSIQGLQHWQWELTEQLQASSEGCDAVVQSPSSQLQFGAVQQDHIRLLLELEQANRPSHWPGKQFNCSENAPTLYRFKISTLFTLPRSNFQIGIKCDAFLPWNFMVNLWRDFSSCVLWHGEVALWRKIHSHTLYTWGP